MSPRRFLGRPVIVPGRHSYAQAELAERFREGLAGLEGGDSIRQMVGFIFEHSAIERRHLEFDLDAIEARTDWYLLVNEATLSLARRTLEALAQAGTILAELDGLVVVSSSFAGFPALSRRLQVALGLSLEARCFDLAGLGCAGPTHGLALADMLVATGACQKVAVVCVDATGTHAHSRVHAQLPTMPQLVAHCLASDGAAAMTVSADRLLDSVSEPGFKSLSYASCVLESRLWPESLGENDFTASPDNQPLIAVGKAIRTRLLDELGPLIADVDPDTTLFHPGGAALMRTLGAARPELASTLALSNAVLREHGNIGAASVVWVLHAAWTQGRRLGPILRLVALGPGIVSTQLVFEGIGESPQ